MAHSGPCACNQNNNDADERISFFGSNGTLVVTGSNVTFTPQDVAPRFEPYRGTA